MTLDEAFQARQTCNLDVLRLALAICVIVSHAWPRALGATAMEPLESATQRSLGGWAVGGFFFISGMLITASAQRGTGKTFWIARVRRIFPGLGVALLVTLGLAVAFGATVTVGESVIWFCRAFSLVSIEHRLSEAFAENPLNGVVNGPIWSLFHEIVSYVVCASFVIFGGMRWSWIVVVLAVTATSLAAVHDDLPARFSTFTPLFAAFAWGMVAYIWRNWILLRWEAGLALILLGAVLPWSVGMGAVAMGLVMLVLLAPEVPMSRDVSFGMYIYGWPVAQSIVALIPEIGPVALAGLSVIVTYPFAALSWDLVERPFTTVRRAEV
ncbi:acyltransferase family protein [Pseudopelagicola sp. nBUS_19]|uniref:acyltransferase family protein n=1 Tax=Pseudopelagicola sp. nBUS_19 TaxID=3395316 RepID=UPI003EBB7B2B